MRKTGKKSALALAVLLNIMAVGVEAATTSTSITAGQKINFGHYWQTKNSSWTDATKDQQSSYNKDVITWIALTNLNSNKITLLSEQGLYADAFNNEQSSGNKWSTSEVFATLNNRSGEGFAKDAFSDAEWQLISTKTYDVKDEVGTARELGITSKLYFLERSDVIDGGTYSTIFNGNDSRKVAATDYAQGVKVYGNDNTSYVYNGAAVWWLRTKYYNYNSAPNLAYTVFLLGDVTLRDVTGGKEAGEHNGTVRPALDLNLQDLQYVSVGGVKAGAAAGGDSVNFTTIAGDSLLDVTLKDTGVYTGAIVIGDTLNLSDGKIGFDFSGGIMTDAQHYVSALFVDNTASDGEKIHGYGVLAQGDISAPTSGEVNISSLDSGKNYEMQVSNEYTFGGSIYYVGNSVNLAGTFSVVGGKANYTVDAKALTKNISIGSDNKVILTGTGTDNILTKTISGDGTLEIDGEVSSSANNIGAATNTVNIGKTLILIGGTLSKDISGNGVTKLGDTVNITTNQSISNLDGNGKTLNMQGSDTKNTLTVGTLKGDLKLNLDVDMSDCSTDKLNVTTIDNDTNVLVDNINITADITAVPPQSGTDAIVYLVENGTTPIHGTYGVKDNLITVVRDVLTNQYKYSFTAGSNGTLSYAVSTVDAFDLKDFIEGTIPGSENPGDSDIDILSLTDDKTYVNTSANEASDNQTNNSLTINLNGHKLIKDGTLTDVMTISTGTKTLNINGGSTEGSTDIKFDVGNGGKLNIGGNINIKGDITNQGNVNFAGTVKSEGQLSGAGTYTNSGTLIVEDSADLQMTDPNGIVNTGIVNLGNSTETVLDVKISGGTLNIKGKVATKAEYIAGEYNIVESGNVLALTEGTLYKIVTGDGDLKIVGNVNSSANYIETNNTIIESSGVLSLTDGILGKVVTGDGTLKVVGNISSDASYLTANNVIVENSSNLNLTDGTLTKGISNSGTVNLNSVTGLSAAVTGGNVNVNQDLTTNADNLQGNINKVCYGKVLALNAGNLIKSITNEGTVNLIGISALSAVISNGIINVNQDLTTNADYLRGDLNTVGSTYSLTLDNGTVEDIISNNGVINLTNIVALNSYIIDGTINIKQDLSANASYVQGTINTVETGKTLSFNSGTLFANLSGGGNVEFNNTVVVDNGVDLGTANNTVNGTLDVVGNITANKIIFANGSILKVDANSIKTIPAISNLTNATIEAGSKLYVKNAIKDTEYKILDGSNIDVNSWTTNEDMATEFQASYGLIVDTDNTTIAGTGLSEFHIQFKEDPDAIKDSDIGTIIKELPMDSEPKQWIEKISVNQNNTVEKGNTINTMVNMGNLANVQCGSFMMSNYTVDEVFNNIGVERRNIVRVEKAKILNTECTPNNNNTDVETVEQGKASEVMPTQYEEQKYGKEVWASFIHSKTKIEGMKSGHLEQDSTLQYNGTVVGVDLWSGRHGFGGVALTYGNGNFHSGQMVSNVKNDADYYGISVYNRQDVGKFSFQYDAGFTYAKNDVTMSTAGAEDVTAKPKVRAYSAGFKVEEPIKVGRATEVVPFVGARYTFLRTQDYKNSLGLGYDVDNQHLVKIPVGMSLRTKYLDKSGWKFGTTLSGGYSWNLCNRSSQQRVSFGGYSDMIDFDIADRGEYFVNAAVQAEYENLLFELGYNYSKGKTTRSNKWYVNANLGF